MKEATVMPKIYDTWWEPILAIPPHKSCAAYKRLRRMWLDHTRVGRRHGHEYFVHEYETHLTIALWENFAALPVRIWLPFLVERSGLTYPDLSVSEANWSYGWVSDGDDRQTMDLVLNYRDGNGEGIIVVEAKRPGNKVSGKDFDPSYYLEVPAFRPFRRRSILYLLGRDGLAHARGAVRASGHDVGFLAWPQLGEVQVEAALAAFSDQAVGSLIASAIYRQFRNYGQQPSGPPLSYLSKEPSRSELESTYGSCTQTSAERKSMAWRLDRLEHVNISTDR